MYFVAQLFLHREANRTEIMQLLSVFEGEIGEAEMLSADLCLRFLPVIQKQLILVDEGDFLLPILDDILQTWHYSNFPRKADINQANRLTIIPRFPCLYKMYIERIIAFKCEHLALHPVFMPQIRAYLGNHSNELWEDFYTNLLTPTHDSSSST